jgi:hypothetical protein
MQFQITRLSTLALIIFFTSACNLHTDSKQVLSDNLSKKDFSSTLLYEKDTLPNNDIRFRPIIR